MLQAAFTGPWSPSSLRSDSSGLITVGRLTPLWIFTTIRRVALRVKYHFLCPLCGAREHALTIHDVAVYQVITQYEFHVNQMMFVTCGLPPVASRWSYDYDHECCTGVIRWSSKKTYEAVNVSGSSARIFWQLIFWLFFNECCKCLPNCVHLGVMCCKPHQAIMPHPRSRNFRYKLVLCACKFLFFLGFTTSPALQEWLPVSPRNILIHRQFSSRMSNMRLKAKSN